MSAERKPLCVLGNGECPLICPINEAATEITVKLEENFEPYKLRLAVVFWDGFDPDVAVADIKAVFAKCVLENNIKRDSQEPSDTP